MPSTRFRDGLKKEANMHDSFVHCSLDSRRAQFSEGATNCEHYYTTSEMKGGGQWRLCTQHMLNGYAMYTFVQRRLPPFFLNSFCRHAHDLPAYPSSKAFGFGHQLIKTSSLLKNEGSEAHRRFGTFRGHVSLDSGKSQLRTISAYSDIQHRLNKIGCATFA